MTPAPYGQPAGGFLMGNDRLERGAAGRISHRVAAAMKSRPPVDQDLLAVIGPEAISRPTGGWRCSMRSPMPRRAWWQAIGATMCKDFLKRLGRATEVSRVTLFEVHQGPMASACSLAASTGLIRPDTPSAQIRAIRECRSRMRTVKTSSMIGRTARARRDRQGEIQRDDGIYAPGVS